MIFMADTILYFGSFNPPHNGHTGVARYVAEQELCEDLWFVVSPRNPFKECESLAPGKDRLEMMRIAVSEELKDLPASVCDIEFSLPRPSYTIDTLRELELRYPEKSFALLGGADLVESIHNWKESETLLTKYKLYIYPRDGFPMDNTGNGTDNFIFLNDAPHWGF